MCADTDNISQHSRMCKLHKRNPAILDEYTLPKSAQMMYNICTKLDSNTFLKEE